MHRIIRPSAFGFLSGFGHRISVLLAWLLLSCAAQGQPFSIDWFTVDGGGGTSAGGQFSISGGVGQPDASLAPQAGEAFSVLGGFWSVSSAPPPQPPALLLHIARTSGGQIQVSAQATPGLAATVQANIDLGNPNGWVDLGVVTADAAGLMSFIPVDVPNYPVRFYRFRVP